jgi:thioredoxin reductase
VNLDIDRDADAHALLERFQLAPEEIPVVICRGGEVLKNPDNRGLAECLGINAPRDDDAVHDLVVIGAGPAGLAAAVYAASEGLDTCVVEAFGPGGQAGTSSKIENYLGFPTGISGAALAGRAFSQAQKFGAQINVAWEAVRLQCDAWPYSIETSSGRPVRARTVLIASGAQYRALDVVDLPRFLGSGVYYAATHLEAKLCDGEDVIVVGGGNSAGQAAVFLSGYCGHVHILVRAPGLAESMSSYLIGRIESTPNISLHVRTQITGARGRGPSRARDMDHRRWLARVARSAARVPDVGRLAEHALARWLRRVGRTRIREDRAGLGRRGARALDSVTQPILARDQHSRSVRRGRRARGQRQANRRGGRRGLRGGAVRAPCASRVRRRPTASRHHPRKLTQLEAAGD